nr:ribonuclease H-like domain-containing protein [Tanacetum cinerariifolium]
MPAPNSVHNTHANSEHGDDYVEDLDLITRISKLDVSDPLHLHPNDSSSLTVVSIKLKELRIIREVLPDVRSAYATISSEESYRVASNSVSDVLKSLGVLLILERRNLVVKITKNKGVSNNDSVGTSSSSGFSDEQMATLLSLIKNNNIGKIVQANMASYPNGTEAFISKIGNLKLSNGLTLYDVMVILEYCVTLISVHKMAKKNKIFAIVDESKRYFVNQDLNLRNVMGTGD